MFKKTADLVAVGSPYDDKHDENDDKQDDYDENDDKHDNYDENDDKQDVIQGQFGGLSLPEVEEDAWSVKDYIE